MTILFVSIGGFFLSYLACNLWAYKLINDYWRYRFQTPPPLGKFNWMVLCGPSSLFGALSFRLMHLRQGRFPPLDELR